MTLDFVYASSDRSKLTLNTLQCAACASTQSVSRFIIVAYEAHCCAAGLTALCALQYISAMCKVLQIEVAGFDAVLLCGITFCHILIAAVCGHVHGHVIIMSDNCRLLLIVGL